MMSDSYDTDSEIDSLDGLDFDYNTSVYAERSIPISFQAPSLYESCLFGVKKAYYDRFLTCEDLRALLPPSILNDIMWS